MSQRGDKSIPTVGVTGIVLAAGLSSRWGDATPKQLARFRGQPLVRRAARALTRSKVASIVVVVGHHEQRVRAALAGIEATIVTNPHFREGQSTSIHQGLRQVQPDHAAAVITPCDQPLLDAELIDALIDTFFATGAPAVVPCVPGRRGAPALIARALFPTLRALEGDMGARRVLGALGDRVATVPIPSELPLLDVDTPDDLARLEALAASDFSSYN